jgi:hypothetical protein
VPNSSIPGGRRSKRIATKKRARLAVNSRGHPTLLPCVIVNVSHEGFRLRGDFRLRRGQLVELVVEEAPLNSVLCEVVWTGKAGSGHEGEAGLETVVY